MSEDNTEYIISFDKDFLKNVEKNTVIYRGEHVDVPLKNISGKVLIFNAETRVKFDEYPVLLHANTAPHDIKNACLNLTRDPSVCQTNREVKDSSEYYLCFCIPYFSNDSVHYNDTHTLKINNETYYFNSTSSATNFFSDKERTISVSSDLFKTDAPKALDYSGQETELFAAASGSYQFSGEAAPSGYRKIWYKTNKKYQSGTLSYTVKIEDDGGLNKSAIATSSTYKLSEPQILKIKSPETFFAASDSAAAGEDGYYTAYIKHDNQDAGQNKNFDNVDIIYEIVKGSTRVTSGTFNTSKANPYPVKIPYGKEYRIKAFARKSGNIDSEQVTSAQFKIIRNGSYYVKNTGSDTTGLGTKEKPFRTIQKCISEINDQIQDGDFVNEGYVINLMSNITFCDADNETEDGMINISVSKYSTSASISTDKNITLTIKGDSQKRTIDALYNSRVLNVNGDKLTLNLENLVIENGVANYDSGAGINITSGKLNLTNVDICSCTAESGAGLYINKDGNCVYNSGKIYSNTAVKDGGTGGDGSGIYVKGKLTLGTDTDAVVITDNKQYGDGAVCYCGYDVAKVTLKNAEVLNNYKITDESTKEKSNFYFDYTDHTNAIVISGMLSKTKISITTKEEPTKEEKVAFARVEYNDFLDHGAVDPWKYFTLDKLGYNDIEINNEGWFNLVKKQGSVISDPFYIINPSLSVKNISNENLSMEKVDGVLYIPFGTSNKLEFELQAEETEGQLVSVSGTKNWNFTLYTANEKIGLDKGLYSFKDNVLTLNSNLPAQEYYLDVQFTLASGRPYNESIKILQNTVANCETAPTTGTYTISSDAELEKLRIWVNNGDFVNESGFLPLPEFVLQCDLTIEGDPIGNSSENCLNVIFDGNGHTVTKKSGAPFIGYAKGVIKNLNVKGKVNQYLTSGGVTYAGGIVTFAAGELNIVNCISEVEINIVKSNAYVGGIIANCNSAVVIVNSCINRGDISCTGNGAGGIVACAGNAYYYDNTSNKYVNTYIVNCSNYGNINSSTAGGIVSYKPGGRVENCANYGDITGSAASGGIIGSARATNDESKKVVFYNCINYGKIQQITQYEALLGCAGQIIGENDTGAASKEYIEFERCFYCSDYQDVPGVGKQTNPLDKNKTYQFEISRGKSIVISPIQDVSTSDIVNILNNGKSMFDIKYLKWIYEPSGIVKLNYQD